MVAAVVFSVIVFVVGCFAAWLGIYLAEEGKG